MTEQHTPGPWEARLLIPDGMAISRAGWEIRTPEYDVATWIHHGGPIRKEADARLIAAAPDLLAACEAALPLIEAVTALAPDWPELDSPIKDMVKAAIRKAKGD